MLGIGADTLEPSSDTLAPGVLAAANINPSTRLATDYLNHFNNVVMLMELIASMPECAEEVLDWTPMAYPDYFAGSHFRHKELAVAAYAYVAPAVRHLFLSIVARMDGAMAEAQALLRGHDPSDPEVAFRLRSIVRDELQPLIVEASGVINGTIVVMPADEFQPPSAQDSIDELFS
jgi:hypothetical protein